MWAAHDPIAAPKILFNKSLKQGMDRDRFANPSPVQASLIKSVPAAIADNRRAYPAGDLRATDRNPFA